MRGGSFGGGEQVEWSRIGIEGCYLMGMRREAGGGGGDEMRQGGRQGGRA